jgi:flagellar M-ring protein FliF
MQALKVMLEQLVQIWKQLGINQKIIIVVSGIAVAAGLGAMVFFSSRPDYALLYGKLDSAEAGKIVAALDEAKTPYQVGQGGAAIYVSRDKVHVTRMNLAAKGLPKSGDGVGYEIFDKPSFGMSDFVQRANYLRALQGELARTISQIEGVESARVMIVAPENRLIVDPNKKPTASVFVKLRGVGRLEQPQVGAIRFLIANSVEGLKPNHVSVVDNFGNALSESDDDGSLTALTSGQLAARRNLEKYLASKVETLLDKVVGPGQAVVRVAAEVNHDQVNLSSEFFDPKSVERMTKSMEETTKSADPKATGTPGTTTNINTDTNNAAIASLNASEMIRRDNTKEYAISRATTNIIQIAGEVKRITAAVLVNKLTDATGKRIDRTTEEVEKLRRAVQNALGMSVGQDAARRDEITLEEVVFNDVAATALTEKFEKENRTQFYWEIAKNVLYGLLVVGALFLFWKLAQRSSAELIPAGVPVGQLLGGQLVYQGMGPASSVGMMAAGASGGDAAEKDADDEKKADEEVPDEDDVEVVKAKKQKLVMDFGLAQQRPERVTIEVLKDLIKENPNKMSAAARHWLSQSKEAK